MHQLHQLEEMHQLHQLEEMHQLHQKLKRRLELLCMGPMAAQSADIVCTDVHSAKGGLQTVNMDTPSVEIELC